MSNHHQRTESIPHVRLTQPLPPLPLNDIPPRLSIATQIPYHDDPEDDTEPLSAQSLRSPSQPPRYEPMYDYLRSRQQININLRIPTYTQHTNSQTEIVGPYRDEPFVVTIIDSREEDVSQPPPPSYNELYRQNEIELEDLARQFEAEGEPAENTEMICKWIVAMLLVALTVAAVGTAFNWGKPTCNWANRSSRQC